MVNQDGRVLFSPQQSGVFRADYAADAADLRTNEVLGRLVVDAMRDNTGLRQLTVDGTAYFLVGAPMPKAGGPALAMWDPEDLALLDEKYRFRNRTVTLQPGDAIFQYTDGVTEATNAENELFGEARLLEAMNSAPSAKPKELLPHVRARIDAFVQDAPQFDDITMLGLQLC